MKPEILSLAAASLLAFQTLPQAGTKIAADCNVNATRAFKFKNVPPPSRNDAAAEASFTIVDGERDPNSGDLDKLHDGKLPAEEDQPRENFFFNAGSAGGRLVVDLGSAIEIKQVNTYSWHAGARGPQVYQLYGGVAKDAFNAQPKRGIDPEQCGWTLIAKIGPRPSEGKSGGQYGVSISDSDGSIGRYRYLLFDIAPAEDADAFGNTFYSEIDVIKRNAPEPAEATAVQTIEKTFEWEGGKYQIVIDTSAAPDLTDWAEQNLGPVAREWYPKIVKLLPSDGYEAPRQMAIRFRDGMGGIPASTDGSRINCNSAWFRRNLKGEAMGAVVHEMVHVVQQYGRARRNRPDAARAPGWLVEGIADYIRWFLYEPQTHGADITTRNISRARYDGNYRITANFLNWLAKKYDPDIVGKLNAAAREGRYSEDLWKRYTGHTVQELGEEWKASNEKHLTAPPAAGREPKAVP